MAKSTYWLSFDPEVKNRAWAAMSDVHDLPRPKMFRKKVLKAMKAVLWLPKMEENHGSL